MNLFLIVLPAHPVKIDTCECGRRAPSMTNVDSQVIRSEVYDELR